MDQEERALVYREDELLNLWNKTSSIKIMSSDENGGVRLPNSNGGVSSVQSPGTTNGDFHILNQTSNVSNLDPTNSIFNPTQQSIEEGIASMSIVNSSGMLVPQQVVNPTNSNNSKQGGGGGEGLVVTPAAVITTDNSNQHFMQKVLQQQTAIMNAATTSTNNNNNNNNNNQTTMPIASIQPQQQQQQQLLLSQQAIYHEKKIHASHHHHHSSGRVPASRRDGRKLFVGGLPNEISDLSFLQFFQQYGEVIDSVVLLDRRTKRSRGFGFVTFADPSISTTLLNIIPGRTGVINIMGKNCELKASEPKTDYYSDAPHMGAINLSGGYHHQQHQVPQPMPMYHQQQQQHQAPYAPPQQQQQPVSQASPYAPPQQQQQPVSQASAMPQQQQVVFGAANGIGGQVTSSNGNGATQQRVIFGAGGAGGTTQAVVSNDNTAVRNPLQVNKTMTSPFNGQGGGKGGVSIYSYSTITHSTVSIDGTQDGTSHVYIQNNFYTLPSSTELPPSQALNCTGPSPEALRAHQTELVQNGGPMALSQVGGVGAAQQPPTTVIPQYTSYSTTQQTTPAATTQPLFSSQNNGQQ